MRKCKPIFKFIIYFLFGVEFFLNPGSYSLMSQSNSEEISLVVGESKVLKFKSIVKEVSLDDLSVVGVVKGEDKTQIQLVAKKRGKIKGSVSFYDQEEKRYILNVYTDLDVLEKKIKQDWPYLSTRISDSKVVVEGKFKSESDRASFKKKYGSLIQTRIIDKASYSAEEIATICKNINNLFREAMITNVKAISYGSSIVIEGSFTSQTQTDKIKRIASGVYPQVEIKLDKNINASDTLNVEVLFIEVERRKNLDAGNKSFMSGYHEEASSGLLTAKSLSDSKTTKIFGSSFSYQVGPIYMFLDLIEKTVVSKIFSHPKLVVRSGHAAKFHAGNKIFIQKNIIDNGISRSDYEEVLTGIEIGIVPKVDSISRIDNDIHIKVSNVQSVKDVPDIAISEIDTAVTIDNGQSILLSGLSLKEDKKSVDKIPVIGSIPLIGELFKYRSKQGVDKEILVILTVSKVNSYLRPTEIVDSLIQKADQDISFSVFD